MTDSAAAYVICSNPRSGTTLLCDMLARTGVAGRPDSFFREKSLQEWCDDWGITGPADPQDPEFTKRYFDAMRKEGRGDTPVFGMRVMGPDLGLACAWLDRAHPGQPSAPAGFDAAFGPTRFVHLSRADKLAEAVSYLRAEQTGFWHQRPDGSALEHLEPTQPEGFDAAAIHARKLELAGYDAAWEAWFAAEGITPLRITYEALAENPNGVLALVLAFIGQDPALASGVAPGVRKLANATSAAWIARYRSLYPDG
ncbi:Stf0 family sulfotransferase [Marimonas sp. MJW-29]|uniref:Stf0 family sulfotransferase n=1 Tax=Sulfitobacter sediminis TaxID=3234186 RepID=A0ABV3RT33_9RHOB